MKMKFFLDTNMPYSSKSVLKELGHNAMHARDAGLVASEDKGIIKYASSNKRILITKDIDFGNPKDYPSSSHCGVIILRLPFYFTAKQINDSIKRFFKTATKDNILNAVVIVELDRYRVRR